MAADCLCQHSRIGGGQISMQTKINSSLGSARICAGDRGFREELRHIATTKQVDEVTHLN